MNITLALAASNDDDGLSSWTWRAMSRAALLCLAMQAGGAVAAIVRARLSAFEREADETATMRTGGT